MATDNIARGLAVSQAVFNGQAASAGVVTQSNVIKAVGDSRIAAIFLDSAVTSQNYSAPSPLNWANALLGQRMIIGKPQYGVSAERTDQFASRVDQAIASTAGLIYLQGGANDIGQNYPTAGTSGLTAASNLIAYAEKARKAGKVVVIEAETGSTGWSATQIAQMLIMNRALREYVSVTPGVYLHDARPAIYDPAAAANAIAFKTGYAYDATHVNGRGAYHWGKSLALLLDKIVPARPSPLLSSKAEADPANGRIQLASNALFATGTGGTQGGGATGTVPANWRLTATGSPTSLAGSNIANSLGNSFVIDVNFSAASNEVIFTHDVPTANWEFGDVVQLVADVEVVTPGPLLSVYGQLSNSVDAGATSIVFNDLLSPLTAGYSGPNEACRLTLMTRPQLIPAAGAKSWLTASVRFVSTGAGVAQFKVHQVAVLRRSDQGY